MLPSRGGLRCALAEPGLPAVAHRGPSWRVGGAGKRSAIRRGARLVVEANKTKVTFKVQRQVAFGEAHKIVGSAAELGGWDVDNAPVMLWNEGDVWTLDLDVDVPAESQLEFKCVKVGHEHVEWEPCNNRSVQVPNGSTPQLSIGFNWSEDHLNIDTPGAAEQHDDSGHHHYESSWQEDYNKREHQDHHDSSSEYQEYSRPPPRTSTPSYGQADDRPDHLRWQGKAVEFMRSNQHSKSRDGRWDLDGLEGAVREIVAGDQSAANWLGKMQVVHKILVEEVGKHPDIDALASAFVYLQWINTGAIECKEGGGHYRPNKHAELARSIFKSLERAIGDAEAHPLLHLMARKTQAKLPSFSSEYTQSTPLTRIRDIAHRNDIPHELKQEIKHTIQNKLHRNAGPEDLVATEALLDRVTKDGGYSGDFINELRTFAAELRDFFNAGSLADMLNSLQPALDGTELRAVDHFLEAKGKSDASAANGADGLQDLVDTLHSLTSLRATLLARLSSGLRNDASDESLSMRQRFRLCELRAEDYAFSLLSRLLNQLESQGGAEALVQSGDGSWALPLGATVLAVRQLGLGGWRPQECLALENELGSWQQSGGFNERGNALRLKATLERVRRLTQSYTDGLLSILPDRVDALGRALGIEHERVQVFTESEVRASLVFQLSKLSSLLLKSTRIVTGSGAWDALVAGKATGRLVEVKRLDDGSLRHESGPVIAVVRHASGDEEVGASQADLRGVVLCHGLPHLSHLGVRARQEKVVFVACEDDSAVDSDVTPLLGSDVTLTAGLDSVSLTKAEESTRSWGRSSSGREEPKSAPKITPVDRVDQPLVLPLEEAEVETCGSKAATCAELARLAQRDAAFETAPGVCLPFGNMELALYERGTIGEFDWLLDVVEDAPTDDGKLDVACNALQALVGLASPPWRILRAIGESFDKDARVIVRSSANVEDLAGMSGAGLYESVANVPVSDPKALAEAISLVWASLYSRRAVLTRRAAGVAQWDAAMAVLIQQQVAPDFSFVLHTSSPLEHDDKQLYAELAVGLGETLASGTRGSPWRLAVDKSSRSVKTLAFANFSNALGEAPAGSDVGEFSMKCLDYSQQRLSTDESARKSVGSQLVEVGTALERAFRGPQDVEGGIVGNKVYIVQTRPQP